MMIKKSLAFVAVSVTAMVFTIKMTDERDGYLGEFFKTFDIFESFAPAPTTDTTVGRMELVHPDLGHDGGSGLHTKVRDAWTIIADNDDSRYEEYSAIADSTLSTYKHNFGVDFSELNILLYTGSHPSLTTVKDAVAAGYTIVANGTNPKTEIDITTPGSGGPHTFAIQVRHGNRSDGPEVLNNQDYLDQAESRYMEDDGSGTNYVGFKAGTTLAGNQIWTLPLADGAGGTVLKTDGAGVLDWIAALTDPMTTRGDLIFRNSSNVTDRLPVGAADTVLKSDGTDPSYGKVVNADVDASAAIAGTKIDPDFGSQDVETTGSVSINTTPVAGRQLAVETNVTGADDFVSFYNGNGNETVVFSHDGANAPQMTFKNDGGNTLGSIRSAATNLLDFHDASGTLTMRVQNGGVFVANLSSVNNTGDICTTTTGTGTRILTACSSSKRYKTNIRSLTDEEIEKVYSLRGVNFDWKAENGGHNDFGFIAEEVDLLFPQLAPKNDKGQVEAVNYKHITGLLLEALKAQKKQIEELNQRLDDAGL